MDISVNRDVTAYSASVTAGSTAGELTIGVNSSSSQLFQSLREMHEQQQMFENALADIESDVNQRIFAGRAEGLFTTADVDSAFGNLENLGISVSDGTISIGIPQSVNPNSGSDDLIGSIATALQDKFSGLIAGNTPATAPPTALEAFNASDNDGTVSTLLEAVSVLVGLLSDRSSPANSESTNAITELTSAVNLLAQSVAELNQGAEAVAAETVPTTSVQPPLTVFEFVAAQKQRMADIQSRASSVLDYISGGRQG